MLLENKYSKAYFKIIGNATSLNRKKSTEVYFEKHHVYPKSLGGRNSKDNLILLTAKEHFVCHLLLTKMFDDPESKYKMKWALHKLTFSTQKLRPVKYTSGQYEIARTIHSKNMRENHPSKTNPEWTKNLSASVTKSWENADERKDQFSQDFKRRWAENYEQYKETSRNNLKKATIRMVELRSAKIEYKGKNYLGWSNFKKETGISQGLYEKYYLKGIDPEFRVGKNGPPTKSERRIIECLNLH